MTPFAGEHCLPTGVVARLEFLDRHVFVGVPVVLGNPVLGDDVESE